jgi:hypothetical protein
MNQARAQSHAVGLSAFSVPLLPNTLLMPRHRPAGRIVDKKSVTLGPKRVNRPAIQADLVVARDPRIVFATLKN